MPKCYAALIGAATLLPWVPAQSEPFAVRNQHPLVAIYGLPSPLPARLPAKGTTQAAIHFNWASFATVESRGNLGVTLDGEVFETRVRVDHGWGERFALHAELAYRRMGAGSLDGVIDGWHDAFGFPDGSRDKLPEDDFLLEYRAGSTTPLLVERETAGLADIPIALGVALRESESAAVAAWLSVKVPTGRAQDLTGSGATDVALSLSAEVRPTERWELFGQANVAWLGEGEVLPEAQQDLAWSLLAGASWNAWRRLDLTAQLETNSAVLDTGLAQLDGAATVLTFGGSYVTTGGWRFDVGVSEDLEVDESPDVVFNLGVRREF
jgi:hypothetical protein